MMHRKLPPVWICTLIFVVALLWRMIGAPVTAEHFSGMETHLWQAGRLLPQRTARILLHWHAFARQIDETMDQEVELHEETEIREVWLNVYIDDEERLAQMSLKGYVCGVLAEEMPAAYHLEALKAQAVAARTRAIYQINEGGCALHPGADICTDSSHCQGYASLKECRTKWGPDYEMYRDRILEAERQTKDERLCYDGQPIQVFYHAVSGGRTENAAAVFAQELPYLISVESAGEESVRGFRTDTSIPFDEIAQKLSSLMGKDLSPEAVQKTLAINSYSETGRVESLKIDGETIAAAAFRSALNLRSTLFSMTMNEEGVTFHQQGYGHGVGMSQAGANVMAADGYAYNEILMHYYPGVTIQKE